MTKDWYRIFIFLPATDQNLISDAPVIGVADLAYVE